MVDWIAMHPEIVIVLCEVLVVTCFMIFSACVIWRMHLRSKASEKRMMNSEADYQEIMANYRERMKIIDDDSEVDKEVVLRRVH